MTTRKELVEALRLRYRSAAFSDRIKILDEFVALTCYHRKHAIRVLRGEFSPATEVRQRNRVYDEAVAAMSMASIETHLPHSAIRGLAATFCALPHDLQNE